jgi:hypothetical protein
MQVIQVVKPFMLQLDPLQEEIPDLTDRTGERKTLVTHPSEMRYYEVGVYEVDDFIAEHWYVKAHLKGFMEPPKGPGTAEYQNARVLRPESKGDDHLELSQPMPSDATAPKLAPIPAMAVRAEKLA